MEEKAFVKQNAEVRSLMLLSFLAASIDGPFNAVYARYMVLSTGVGHPAFLMSLPITVYFGMTVLGVICAGAIAAKLENFASVIRFGTLLILIAAVIRAFAFNYPLMLAGFVIAGLGMGTLFVSVRFYAFLFDDSEQRTQALVFVNGGAFAGTCLGIIMGGILAGQVTYQRIYMLMAAIAVIPLFFPAKLKIEGKFKPINYAHVFRVVRDIRSLIFFILILLPVYVCAVFVSYVVPLQVNLYGYSASVTSVLMLVNYLLCAYAAPFLTARISKRFTAIRATLIYMIASAVMIVFYAIVPSLPVMILSVVVCGLLDAFGLTLIVNAYFDGQEGKGFSANEALLVFILVSRLGPTAGPTVILLARNNVGILGALLLAGAVLYMVLGNIKIEEKKE